MVSERPTEARKAKGQASSIMNAAMSSRMGNSVTVINAICKRLRKREKGKGLNAMQEHSQSYDIFNKAQEKKTSQKTIWMILATGLRGKKTVHLV